MIEFINVTKAYKNKPSPALSEISLTIGDGEFVFITGESGAGKTTLTKLLLREEKPTSGSIEVDGKKVEKLGFIALPHYRRQIGFVFQDFRLFPDMTVYENVAFALRAVGKGRDDIAHKVPVALKVVGLDNFSERFPASLSGGEQQRVALARALIGNPKYIIADEPTGNIDPERSREIMEMLVKINNMGKTVIVVTHEQELVKSFGKRVIRIERGHITEDTGSSAHT